MVAWDLYRYAVLNTTHNATFPIHDRKWVDTHDKGADRNIANYRVNSRRERKGSPLARELKEDCIRPPTSSRASPVAIVHIYAMGATVMRSTTTNCSSPGKIRHTPVDHCGASRVGSRKSPSKDEGDVSDAPEAPGTGSHSIETVNLPVPSGPVGTDPRLVTRKKRSKRGGRDSKMAVSSFWDNAFKRSEGVSIS
ncbi:hypothetical protein Q9L58_009038 [Maublancomyces gigas]|uniref:Uncharacterized protein n=1 Tax=Discina gigas TaxID=1032678 RepID=A0ABR3G801_9PEZI